MNRKDKLLSLAGTALIAALLTGSAVLSAAEALGLRPGWTSAYLGAFLASLFCSLCAFSVGTAISAAAISVLSLGIYAVKNLSGGSIELLLSNFTEIQAEGISALNPSAALLTATCAAMLAILVFFLITDRGFVTTGAALLVCLGITTFCTASRPDSSLVPAAVCALGSCAAVAHTAQQRHTGGHLKALLPAALALLIASALLPASGTIYEPLEQAAEKLRSLYEQYFSYTQERVAFSISEKGYDYYGFRGDEPTHLLGGPAHPSDKPVMDVKTEDALLLRGTVRGTYTGYSWEDYTVKTRNLYYDFTRRSRRKAAFQTSLNEKLAGLDAFSAVSGSVTLLSDGSSTLFAPLRLTDFDMSLRDALYYNSVGELFLARNAQEGDTYSFSGLTAASSEALTELSRGMTEDAGYAEALSAYTSLPESIDGGVYRLAEKLMEGRTTDAEIAQAIEETIRASCTYRLDVDYPPQNRDFVSYFLLDSREGYCSYFASAMTVLCRIAGIPARYVEGYRVYPEPDGITRVTGKDAHAWVEVYLKGIGWISYDPTPGNGDGSNSSPSGGDSGFSGNAEPTPTPEPTPAPTLLPDELMPQTSELTFPEPTPEPITEPEPDSDRSGGSWLWLLLLLLAMLALILFLLLRRRLRKTDPLRLAAQEKDERQRAVILYRSNLSLLAQMGHAPLNGETPDRFARRVCINDLANGAFIAFAEGFTLSRYSRSDARSELGSLGAEAYRKFRQKAKRSERLRFDLRRVLRGLGSFDSIP